MLEEGKDLLKNQQYEEAYEFYCNHYEKFHDLESFYYLISIDYYNLKTKTLEEYYSLFLELNKKAPKKFLVSFIHPLATIAYDLKDYDTVIEILKEGEKQGILDGLLYSLFACVLFECEKEYELALEYCAKAIQEENGDDRVKGSAYETRALIYARENKKELALNTINEMHLASLEPNLVDISEFRVYIELNDFEEVKRNLDKALETKENAFDYLIQLINYYERKTNYEKVYEFTKILVDRYSKTFQYPLQLYRNYLSICNLTNRYLEGINFLDSIDIDAYEDDMKFGILEEKAIAYANLGRLEKTRECYQKCYEETKKLGYLRAIAFIYYDEKKYNKSIEIINEILKEDESLDVYFLLGKNYKELGDYEKSDYFYEKGKSEVEYFEYVNSKISVTKNPKKLFYFYSLMIKKIDNAYGYRMKADLYFNGCYNNKINEKKALEFALKAYNESNEYICALSMLGNIYLNMNAYDKAFELFLKGHNKYKENKECSCATAFYCYCLMMGLGTIKNEEEAFDILNNIANENIGELSENGVGLLTYLTIKNNRDLNNLINKLENYHERRYSVTKYFSLYQLKKKLNLDYELDYNNFKYSLKFASKREKKHYKNDPEICFLNNF